MSFQDEIAIRTLWGEARGEPDDGIRAVAHALLNRVADGRWGKTLAQVCLWPSQFSCWNVADPNRMKILGLDDIDPDLIRCQKLYAQARIEADPIDRACFYYADTMPRVPSWSTGMIETAHIGHHRFLRDK